jgi:hypothetical protein
MEEPSVLKAEKASVESELKGEAKSAAAKTADDRKDAGPQTEVYNDGRGCGGGKHTEPKPMDAGTPASQTESANRPANTINKSEGDGEGKEKSAAAKTAQPGEFGGKKAPEFTAEDAKKKESAEKCADCAKMAAGEKCAKCGAAEKAASIEKEAKEKCPKCHEKMNKCMCASKEAAAKTADVAKTADPITDAPMDAAPAEAPIGEAPAEEPMAEAEPPAELPAPEEAPAEDTAAEVLTDEKKMVVEEKIEEAQEAISALEAEILEESAEGEELDYSQIFNEEEMEDKVSSLANEGDEHVAGNGEEYFAPSAAESLEASLEENQMASMEDFFSLRGSDSDPLAHLIAGEIKSAAEVAGMTVVPSFTGEAATHFESDTATGEGRDMENDHEGDLFAEAIEAEKPEEGGFKRVKQDETNVIGPAGHAAAPASTPSTVESSTLSAV